MRMEKLVASGVFWALVVGPMLAEARGGEGRGCTSSSSGPDVVPANCIHSLSGRSLLSNKTSQPQEDLELGHGYLSNSELEKTMKNFVRKCGNISRLYSIGKSVRGIPLWVLEISDKPGQEESEPSFKYVGNMHGDEPLGRELLLYLANWLCANYLKDSLATFIVERVHLHLLPSMNPDGFSLRLRSNANNVDLNRDFPDQFYPQNNDENLRQPETRAIMKWTKNKRFTASASLHGGALVANYPWDGTRDGKGRYSRCPDDEIFRYMATIYSHFHHNMSNNNEFRDGITNGALWYPLYGGMQDWNYIHGSCLELTLEISDVKWPSAKEIPLLWEHNRKSMLQLVASIVKTRVHGKVISSYLGRPLPAIIEVAGLNHSVTAANVFGDYHRMLVPGHSYEVTASLPGYSSSTAHIMLEEEKATHIDFILDPLGPVTGTLQLEKQRESHTSAEEKSLQGNATESMHPNEYNCNCSCNKETKPEWGSFLQRKYLRSSGDGEILLHPLNVTTFFLTLIVIFVLLYVLFRWRVQSKLLKLRQVVNRRKPIPT